MRSFLAFLLGVLFALMSATIVFLSYLLFCPYAAQHTNSHLPKIAVPKAERCKCGCACGHFCSCIAGWRCSKECKCDNP